MLEVLDKAIYVLLGAALAWLAQQYRISKSEQVAVINDHIKDLEKLSDAVREYWLSQNVPNTEPAAVARVRAVHAQVVIPYEDVKKYCYAGGERYAYLLSHAYRTCMGGKFDTSARQMDPAAAIDSVIAIAAVIGHLRACRIRILSTGHFIRSLLGTHYS